MNAKYAIGAVIIVVFLMLGITTFVTNTIEYVSISEATTSKQTVQVMGKIDFEKVNYNEKESRLEFAIYDAEHETKEGALAMDVVYYGIIPGNFEQAISVVIKGKNDGSVFVSDKMYIKCPSKYQGKDGEEYQDVEKHNEANNIESGA